MGWWWRNQEGEPHSPARQSWLLTELHTSTWHPGMKFGLFVSGRQMARTEINCLCTLFYFLPVITSRGSTEPLGSRSGPC